MIGSDRGTLNSDYIAHCAALSSITVEMEEAACIKAAEEWELACSHEFGPSV